LKQVQQIKRQETLKKWLKVITEQRASGLSALSYCRREGIPDSTFYYWQHQIQHLLLQQQEQAEKKPATSPVSQKQNSSAQEPNVQFVALPSATSTESPTSLELRCGPVRLTVTEATSSELLKRMLCVLRDVFPAC